MNYKLRIVILIALLLAVTGCVYYDERNRQLSYDIEQFREFVFETHPKFAHEEIKGLARNIQMRADFNYALDNLIADLPDLTDFEARIRLQEAVAILNDNHFNVLMGFGAETTMFPLGFRWLYDGFYLLTTVEGSVGVSALNHRLTAINGRDIDIIFKDFMSLWGAENIYNARGLFARFLSSSILLESMGLQNDGQATFVFYSEGDYPIEIILSHADKIAADHHLLMFPMFPVDNREQGDLPFFMGIRGRDFSGHNWYYFMEYYDILYIRLELYVQNMDPETFRFLPFADDVKAAFNASSPRAVIIDARNNPGGDNVYLYGLFEFLAQNTDPGMLFHFIDEGSASAALLAAAHLKSLGAVLIGQPPGQNTDFYGFHSDTGIIFDFEINEDTDLEQIIIFSRGMPEYPFFELVEMPLREILELGLHEGISPIIRLNYSGLIFEVPNIFLSASQRYGIDLEFYALRPHVLIEYTIQDWINNRDPLLEYVLTRVH